MEKTEIIPKIPDYDGRNIRNLIKEIFGLGDWGLLSEESKRAKIKILLVLDGLGLHQLLLHINRLDVFQQFHISSIDTVLPSTTAAALTSITTGATPLEHGLVGYRLVAGNSSVLNVLRWQIKEPNDAISLFAPSVLQPIEPFFSKNPAVVTRSEFRHTGFTLAHLRSARFYGWRVTSSIPVIVKELISNKEKFIYLYYDGIDKAAHEYGLGHFYSAELDFINNFLGKLLENLPKSSCLIITSDHGQVNVDDNLIALDSSILQLIWLMSGEGRFRWLHARSGADKELYQELKLRYSDVAWIISKQQMIEEKWLGNFSNNEILGRLGDIAIVAKEPVAFLDPDDTGELKLISRHGSATIEEVEVPLMQIVK